VTTEQRSLSFRVLPTQQPWLLSFQSLEGGPACSPSYACPSAAWSTGLRPRQGLQILAHALQRPHRATQKKARQFLTTTLQITFTTSLVKCEAMQIP